MGDDEGLDYDVIDLLLKLLVRLAHALESVNEAFEGAFVRAIVI